MHQPRSCPHCGKKVPLSGFRRFDQKYNLLCNHCGKVVFAADVSGTEEVNVAIRSKVDDSYYWQSHNKSYHNHPYHSPLTKTNDVDLDD